MVGQNSNTGNGPEGRRALARSPPVSCFVHLWFTGSPTWQGLGLIGKIRVLAKAAASFLQLDQALVTISHPSTKLWSVPGGSRQSSPAKFRPETTTARSVDLRSQQIETIRQCWFLTGATASGKSELSLALASELNAEIISLDSMAIYREMDLGTAKPSLAARQAVPHHLVDILAPFESYSVSQYREAALGKIGEIRQRGKEVLFVGGTALYLQALLKGIFDGPPADWSFRQAIDEEVQQVGLERLHERLKIVDPLSADKLHPNDAKRIIRALEVLHLTGQPISHQQREFEHSLKPEQCRVFWLHRPRPELHSRIEQRVESMFRDGLIGEVEGLLQRHGQLSHTATQAVGYKEVIAHLRGQGTVPETIEQVKIRTRRFARAQETWFRNMNESRQLEIQGEFDCIPLARSIVAAGQTLLPCEE